MSNNTNFRLVGTDEADETVLFLCENCGSIIPYELDENGAINLARMDDRCPECKAMVLDIFWE